MGVSDDVFSRKIPREEVATAVAWEMRSLGETAQVSRSANGLWSERERRAYERGRQDGSAEATRAAQLVRAGHVERIGRVLESFQVPLQNLSLHGADAVLDLALEVARQVVRRELTLSRDAALPIVREALTLITDHTSHPRVHLNPADFDLVSAEFDAEATHRGCRFVPDAAVQPGGCLIETPHGEIDATVATRWRRVVAALGMAEPAWTDSEPGEGRAG